MTAEDAIKLLSNTDHLHEPPNGYYEALDMAIEALQNLSKPNNGLQGSDLISRSRAIKDISYWATNIIDPKMLVKEDALYILESLPSAELAINLQLTCNKLATDLISRQDAIDAWWHDEVFFGNQRDDMTKEQWLDYITDIIGSLPSAGSCKGCKHQGQWENEYEMGYPSPCTVCMRRSKDNYEK